MNIDIELDEDAIAEGLKDSIIADRDFIDGIVDEVLDRMDVSNEVDSAVSDALDDRLAEEIAEALEDIAEGSPVVRPASQVPAFVEARIAALEAQVGRLIDALDAAQKVLTLLAK